MSLRHEYVDQSVTPWGGMQEMKKLLDKTGISNKLSSLGLPQSKSNNSIDAISLIESFWVSIWIGCFRFSHTAVVRMDEVLRQLFGWKRVASGTTFTRFFKKFTPSMNHRLFIEQSLPALEIWEQYKRRGDAENRIKELKEDFGV